MTPGAVLSAGAAAAPLAPDTVADGLRTSLGRLNFELISQYVDDILCADDGAVHRCHPPASGPGLKLVVEPSAAVGLAVVLSHPGHFAGQRVAIVLSGGNVDIDKLPW